MGLIKEAIGLVGVGAGVYAGGIIEVVGSITGSKSLEDFGEKVLFTSADIGERVGDIAEKSVTASINAISEYSAKQHNTNQDSQRINKALDVFNE